MKYFTLKQFFDPDPAGVTEHNLGQRTGFAGSSLFYPEATHAVIALCLIEWWSSWIG